MPCKTRKLRQQRLQNDPTAHTGSHAPTAFSATGRPATNIHFDPFDRISWDFGENLAQRTTFHPWKENFKIGGSLIAACGQVYVVVKSSPVHLSLLRCSEKGNLASSNILFSIWCVVYSILDMEFVIKNVWFPCF
ncbi:hypothetical protein R3W88_020087 [Solanum pinnatisectum]|uniref:Uncharacterized protein n=1 Tax=Solanum pinnatisectum TaxID=50273 RepID=A0AAV9KNE8_9SOLN|nr:hypothetical protein R3W88_020087 [Solanum pinnatisectum]